MQIKLPRYSGIPIINEIKTGRVSPRLDEFHRAVPREGREKGYFYIYIKKNNLRTNSL